MSDLIDRLRSGSPFELTNKLMQEAADALERMQWVSVEERLPPVSEWSGDKVLVYTEEGAIHTGRYEGDEPWWDLYNDSGLITHWMPLPEPPEASLGEQE